MTKRSRPYLVGNNRDNTINNDNVDDCERSTESSSDDEAIGHFASVAVSGEDICRHAAHGLVVRYRVLHNCVSPETYMAGVLQSSFNAYA